MRSPSYVPRAISAASNRIDVWILNDHILIDGEVWLEAKHAMKNLICKTENGKRAVNLCYVDTAGTRVMVEDPQTNERWPIAINDLCSMNGIPPFEVFFENLKDKQFTFVPACELEWIKMLVLRLLPKEHFGDRKELNLEMQSVS